MAAAELVSEGGVGALTMAALADRCDCAVGTAYSYFSSKGALVAAVAVNAADTLRRSQLTARGAWEAHLEAAGVEEQEAALVRLLAYGAFVVAASHAHPNELAMLQAVLGDHQAGVGDAERTECLPALVSFLEEPTSLLRLGEGTGALDAGDARERAVLWLSALNGVLLAGELGRVAPTLVRPAHLARRLTTDLLAAWGAQAAALVRAGDHVERLAATHPMAPPVPPIDV